MTWVLVAVSEASAGAACGLVVEPAELRDLADKVWRNESGRDEDKLLWWNPGEDFASLGIGHFIWYPQGVDGPFRESFPELVAFLAERGASLPSWLATRPPPPSPWHDREQFLAGRGGAMAGELRRLLADTVELQMAFMLERLERSLAAMTRNLSPERANVIESRFCALARLPAGRYALVDYVNFKGEGIDPGERYAGEGWGLRQVLEEMRGEGAPNADFGGAAARGLVRRVRNAPAGRGEQRWLDGWLRRVATYADD